MNELISNKCVCRTAPATPGLFNKPRSVEHLDGQLPYIWKFQLKSVDRQFVWSINISLRVQMDGPVMYI